MRLRGSGQVFGRAFIGLALALALALSGCYYTQAARGQIEVMRKREPIDDVISATDTSAELSTRLQLVQEARRFSVDALHLPDNDSYRTYADLQRDYVVWNVFAAPEFSLQPVSWCFPVAGCVNYRGYFAEDKAQEKAQQLKEDGFDVAVGGVAAYSTLGKFSDPILNTMMRWEDSDLIAVMFHELAHQVLYVKGDSGFNESFASAVEEVGLERWLVSRGESQALAAYRDRRKLRYRLMQRVAKARDDLDAIYASLQSEAEMRAAKRQRLDALQRTLLSEFETTDSPVPAWVSGELNNARLASMILYQGRLAEFRALLDDCRGDLPCFYAAARERAAN
jgi:predicted aminopeptidase